MKKIKIAIVALIVTGGGVSISAFTSKKYFLSEYKYDTANVSTNLLAYLDVIELADPIFWVTTGSYMPNPSGTRLAAIQFIEDTTTNGSVNGLTLAEAAQVLADDYNTVSHNFNCVSNGYILVVGVNPNPTTTVYIIIQ